jgi:formamidopyrimidine-DNA glycosylase
MPELPEVETTRRGIAPHIEGQCISKVIIRQPKLRWPVPESIAQHLLASQLHSVKRRAKYLLFQFDHGCLLIHLGMSGSLRIVNKNVVAGKHDHVELVFGNEIILRLTDPRRFSAVLWLGENPHEHPLLSKLGPEPLSDAFNGEHLFTLSRTRKLAVKQFIMDQCVVTGIGNIYASEALFSSRIRPMTAAGKISLIRYNRLSTMIKQVLGQAIAQGGTTLRDFVGGDGKPGYFKQHLHVYGRAGLPCTQCQAPLQELKLAARASVYCCRCQY